MKLSEAGDFEAGKDEAGKGLNEMLCRWELSTGEIGYGMHENALAGVYHPYGFETPEAVAP